MLIRCVVRMLKSSWSTDRWRTLSTRQTCCVLERFVSLQTLRCLKQHRHQSVEHKSDSPVWDMSHHVSVSDKHAQVEFSSATLMTAVMICNLNCVYSYLVRLQIVCFPFNVLSWDSTDVIWHLQHLKQVREVMILMSSQSEFLSRQIITRILLSDGGAASNKQLRFSVEVVTFRL